jgi:hypothetical protein
VFSCFSRTVNGYWESKENFGIWGKRLGKSTGKLEAFAHKFLEFKFRDLKNK